MLCPSCSFETPDNDPNCIKCGNLMLQHNSLCGMPMLGDNSNGQVLAMRYIIEQQLNQDNTGCVYLAEDAQDKTKVLIRALPLSVSLTSREVELLTECTETIASLSIPNTNVIKTFGVSGKVRYFVYEYSEQQEQQDGNVVEQIKQEAAEKIASEISTRIKAEDKLRHYENELENIKAESEKVKNDHTELLRQATGKLEQQRVVYEDAIKQLNTKTAKQEADLTVALNKANRKIYLLEQEKENILSLNIEREKQLEELKIDLGEQEQNYTSQLNQAEKKQADYNQTIERLKTDAIEQDNNFNLILNEAEQKLETARLQIEAKQAFYEDIIKKINLQMTAEKQEYAANLSQTESKLKEFKSALEESNKTIEILTEEKEGELSLRKEYEKQLEELKESFEKQQQNYNSQLAEITRRIQSEIFAKSQAEQRYAVCEQIIEKLKADAVEQEEMFTAKEENSITLLDAAYKKNEELSAALTEAHEKTESLVEEKEKALQQNKEALDKVRTDANQQQQKYTKQLDNAQWKIGALSSEIEKLLHKGGEKRKIVFESTSASRLKIPMIALALALLLAAIYMVGQSYLSVNTEKTDENLPKQYLSGLNPIKSVAGIKQKEEHFDAEQLYLEKAEKEDSNSMCLLGKAYLEGLGTDKNTEKGISWLKKAGDAGNDDAMFELGLAYYSGQHVEIDYKKALTYFIESSQKDNMLAMYNVGRMYHQGNGVEVDGVKALEFYEKSAQGGLTEAMNQLAQMYYFGDIVKQDYKKAAEYYEDAAQKDNLQAMFNLAILYYNGVGVEKNTRKAMLWFIKAARQGDTESMYQLGMLFQNGSGIQKDPEKAVQWYQTAAKAGHETAREQLKKMGKSW